MVEIEERCAALLRQLRKKRGLTLRECEIESGGRFKAVVMGSYERGTRAISLERLQEIADFYQVPVQYFFTHPGKSTHLDKDRFTFDLRKMRNAQYQDETLNKVAELLQYFMSRRDDWNGEILSIRQGDAELLQIITHDDEVLAKLDFHGLFFATNR